MINSSPSLGYNGLLWSTAISPDWFIVSCSDCSNPFVNFYNRTDLSIGQTYAYPGPYGNSKINLAVYTNNFNTTNVFIGTSDSIDQVEFYQSSNNMWNFFPNVFEINSTTFATYASHEIRVGVSNDYVAFHLSSQDAIFTLANC